MEHAISADGTEIAFERIGSGTPLVVVVGALSTAAAGRPLAAAAATAGMQGICWDRRGRGDSGDTTPYSPEREVEDLAAVIDAVDDVPVVFGHSAGAVLALMAAGSGVPMSHLFASEPPLRFGQDEPPADLADRLQALVNQGRHVEAVLTFQRENVRLPEPVIEELRQSRDFARLVPLAQTTIYDTILIRTVSTPTPEMLGTAVPTTILHGDPAAPMIIDACKQLAKAMPGSELVVVPESHNHDVDPSGTLREIQERIA